MSPKLKPQSRASHSISQLFIASDFQAQRSSQKLLKCRDFFSLEAFFETNLGRSNKRLTPGLFERNKQLVEKSPSIFQTI